MMRIACLQFAPQVGDVNNNLTRADAVIFRAHPENLDLLVLPELAFSGKFSSQPFTWPPSQTFEMPNPKLIEKGYNSQSQEQINPFLEPTEAGISSLWARTIAVKYRCVVMVGYAEGTHGRHSSGSKYYNSVVTVSPAGEIITHTCKSFLYGAETRALEGPKGLYAGYIEGLGNVAIRISMDIKPYKFESPWTGCGYTYNVLYRETNIVIISLAWLAPEDLEAYSTKPREPDMDALLQWIGRFEPIIRDESGDEMIVVIANRCGTEGNVIYAGTSVVLGIHNGEVKVYGILGRGEKELLMIDTTNDPQAKLVLMPTSEFSTHYSAI